MRIAVARGAVPVTATVPTTVTVADEGGVGRQWGGRHDGGPTGTC